MIKIQSICIFMPCFYDIFSMAICNSNKSFFLYRDNTCEINLMDMFDRKDVKADQFEKGTITDIDSIAGRYAAKSRKTTVKVFTKSATL